jgi:hypothetical protein
VDSSQIQTAFDDVYDQALVFHGFADYMRDDEVFVDVCAALSTGIQPRHLLYRFKHCVRAVVTTRLDPELWQRSLDERLVGGVKQFAGNRFGRRAALQQGISIEHAPVHGAVRADVELGVPAAAGPMTRTR